MAELRGTGRQDEIVVVGAHYDTHKDSPGANDNASAVAALLELSRALAQIRPERTLRFVAFTTEEAPFTRTEDMGSRVYARACRQRGDNVVAMLGLEMLGCCLQQDGANDCRSAACCFRDEATSWRWWEIAGRSRSWARYPEFSRGRVLS